MRYDWVPHPKQIEALKRKEFEVLYGGARGGGKTACGIAWLLYNKDRKDFRALVIRRNSEDLKDWIDRAKNLYAKCDAVCVGAVPEFRFPSGALVRTGHLKDEDAYTKYQGHEYQNILIEELTQIPREEDYLKLIASCRSTVRGISPQVFSTTNPGGLGMEWVRGRFIEPMKPGMPYRDPKTGRSRIFVPAKIFDNPTLMDNDPGYMEMLKGLPDGLRQQWLDGSWDDYEVEGSYYGRLLFDAQQQGRIRVLPFDQTIKVDTYWDLGMHDATAIWFVQSVMNEHRFIDYFEGSGEGLGYYINVLQEKQMKYHYTYGEHWGPHDLEVHELGTGRTRREMAQDLGLYMFTAPKLPIQDGINASRMVLPRCWFDEEKCKQGIKYLKNYRKEYDEKRGDFKSYPLHDNSSHAADAFRTFAVSHKKKNLETRSFNNHNDFDPYSVI